MMQFKDLKNESEFDFIDISSEEVRSYDFGNGNYVTIEKPIAFSVSESGGARIVNESEQSYYVPSGWICLTWVPKADQPNFVA